MIENLIISPETEAGKMVLANKLNTIIDTINEQKENIYHLKEGQTVLRAELYKLEEKIDFIMENTEVPTVVDNDANKTAYKFLKELYKE